MYTCNVYIYIGNEAEARRLGKLFTGTPGRFALGLTAPFAESWTDSWGAHVPQQQSITATTEDLELPSQVVVLVPLHPTVWWFTV